MNNLISKSSTIFAVIVLVGCNRGDKPQAWESNHARPMQESIAADSQDSQMPPGHPPIDGAGAETSGALPPGHPPIAPSADAATISTAKNSAANNSLAVDLDDMHWTAAKSWVRKEPASPIIRCEYKLPRAEGDTADGRLTISAAGGTVEQNLNRWRGQFGSKPEKDATEQMDVAGLKLTLVDLEGTFKDGGGPMMGGAAVDRPGYRMLGAVMPRGDALIFVKAYGPSKTMAARADEVRAFLKSLKIDK